MCGIAGLLDPARSTTAERLGALAGAMATPMLHRGPDDSGIHVDAANGLGFGFRRLSIIDLSPAGHQPMSTGSGRWVIAFNGEIYNHAEMRRDLASIGARFRGHSDTEVLIEAIEAWGLERALQRTNGMFAFAAFDTDRRELHLVRDRLGEKPLFYGWAGDHIVFGSELKALRAHPQFAGGVDPTAVALFFRHTFVPAPHCIHPRTWKLPAGHVLTIPIDGTATLPEPRPWWSLTDLIAEQQRKVDHEELLELLTDSVRLRLVADVPVGAFLSGGIDSSLVCAIAQSVLPDQLRTFTIAMPEDGLDERRAAQDVAHHLGTRHTSIGLSSAEGLELVPRLTDVYDEPFGDPSGIPTLLVAREARHEVTVALSGDGGDEVFGGYNRYVLGRSFIRRAEKMPAPVRHLAGRSLLGLSHGAVQRLLDRPTATSRVRLPADKVQKLGRVLMAESPDDVYRTLLSDWEAPAALLVPAVGTMEMPGAEAVARLDLGPSERMMALDALSTLPEGMLTKADRATMACSLEARMPLLDHRVVEAAWRFPAEEKIAGGRGKLPLRRALAGFLPQPMIDRPKLGFDPPLASWLRGPLRRWADDLLDPAVLRAGGLLRPDPITQRWQEHLSGRRNWEYALWSVLQLQAWLRSNG